MEIKLNGEIRDVPDGITIDELMTYLNLQSDRLAVECNREVVRRTQWPVVVLEENDQIEIIHFVGGGDGTGDR